MNNKDKCNFSFEYMEMIEMQRRETEEEFAYAMISPFCETIVEKKLSKKELERILRKGMQHSIPLDKVKQAREEIKSICSYGVNESAKVWLKTPGEIKKEVLTILDKLIESGEKE